MDKRLLVLLAEEDRDLANSLKRTLDIKNMDLTIANDGVQAINYQSNQIFDVIIIDEKLSRINTKEVIDEIKQKNNIPIIILFEDCTLNKKIVLDNFGYDGFMLRPFSLDLLLDEIDKVISIKRNNDFKIGNMLISYRNGTISNGSLIEKFSAEELIVLDNIISNKKIEYIKGFNLFVKVLNIKMKNLNLPFYIENRMEKGFELVRYDQEI